MHYLIMGAPSLTDASCHLREESLGQKLTLRRKISEKTSKLFEANQY